MCLQAQNRWGTLLYPITEQNNQVPMIAFRYVQWLGILTQPSPHLIILALSFTASENELSKVAWEWKPRVPLGTLNYWGPGPFVPINHIGLDTRNHKQKENSSQGCSASALGFLLLKGFIQFCAIKIFQSDLHTKSSDNPNHINIDKTVGPHK